MIDNVPGRGTDRPLSTGYKGDKVTNRFGYDECLRLCGELSSEVIVVVNFRDGVLQHKPLEEAAQHAASLLAYCNAPLGAELPQGMEDWPAIRAQNGHAKPYRVKYVQIGNETWFCGRWLSLNRSRKHFSNRCFDPSFAFWERA